ncbi:MAG: acyloxyacyl hydrolase [Terracidiphilus sp.]
MLLPVALLVTLSADAQPGSSAPFQIFGSFTYLSNSFNGTPGARQPLTGWDASVSFPPYRHLRFLIDVSDYSGNNLGARQHAYFIMAGGEYERYVHKEGLFLKALVGDGGINRNWGANAAPGGTASFSTFVGGGVDTPISRRFAFRVEGGFQHTNFDLIQSPKDPVPYRIPGLPNYFGRISTGLIWVPRLYRTREDFVTRGAGSPRSPVDSELIFEGLNSFGHYHVFAATWWSYLHVGGVEYDRHSWGSFIGARLDYVAEVLPVAFLRQPSKTDVFGDPLTQSKTTIEGLGISPIGLRMIWRDGKNWKPYYMIKGGMIGFTHKALSEQGSYENFTLQQSLGIQFRLNRQLDFRAGLSDFHFSNGFIVPNNPGIDEMSYNAGLSYHLTRRQPSF